MLSCVRMFGKHNAIYGIDDLNRGMMRGALSDASVGGCINATTRTSGAGPSARWHAYRIKATTPEAAQEAFEAQIKRQCERLSKAKRIPKRGLTIAIDLHKISRYDRSHDENLSRQKKKDGTTYAERYITAECIDDGLGVTLGVLHVKRLDSVPESAGLILDQLERAGIKVRLLLLDREFFSVEVIAMLQERGVKFLMPCRNTGNVVAALNEFDDDKRSRVSGNIIENNTDSATYTMIITDRKKSGDDNKPVDAAEDRPEKKLIGFATNCPKIRIELYSSRWGIETGYAKLEECRAKTRTVDLAARMLCFYYSMVLFNEWIIIRALLSEGPGVQNVMTMLVFKECMGIYIREPKPPP